MASLVRMLSLRLCGALIAGGLALPQQAHAATQCVNQNAPSPLEICVGDDATPGVWVSQPNGRQYQYYGGTGWGTAIHLDGANGGLQFSTQYFPLNSVTPVSNVTTGSGTAADPYIITTVVALGLRYRW